MTLWQNELSVFRIKIVPFAKLPRLGNDWFHFHSVWARHQNQWKSLLKWCEKNYTDWVSNQNNKFLRLVDVNLNLIMLVTVFTPSSDPPFCQSHKPSHHSSHSSLSAHHHYLSFTSQLKWEIINSKGRNLPLLFKSLKGSPHLQINLSSIPIICYTSPPAVSCNYLMLWFFSLEFEFEESSESWLQDRRSGAYIY